MEVISHLFKDDKDCWHIQNNEEHLEGVAKLAEGFADELSHFKTTLGKIVD